VKTPAAIMRAVCNRCGYDWYPKTPDAPKRCPKCESPYWNRPRVRKDWPKSRRAKKQARRATP